MHAAAGAARCTCWFWLLIDARTADCEWKKQAGNVCAASFDWSCSGICKSPERMRAIHSACGEGADAAAI